MSHGRYKHYEGVTSLEGYIERCSSNSKTTALHKLCTSFSYKTIFPSEFYEFVNVV